MKEMEKNKERLTESRIREMVREEIASRTNGMEGVITLFYDPYGRKVTKERTNPRDIQIKVMNITRDENGNIADWSWDYDDEIDFDNMEKNVREALIAFINPR